MTLSGDYVVRDFAGATGGKAITLPMGKSTTGKVGHATTTFSGESGLYEVELGYFKENDGGAKIDFLVNGVKIGRSNVFDKDADKQPNAANFSTSTYEVMLAQGDTIEVVGIGDNWAFAVVDHINLKPLFVVEPDPPVISVDDTATISVGDADTVAGNVLTNDLVSDGSPLMLSVAVPLSGNYGLVEFSVDGGFVYDLDETNSAVSSLETGETLTEVFPYQSISGGGDKGSANLTVTINGSADPKSEPPTVTTIEAEAMTLSGDYVVRDLAGATGGKAVTLPMGNSTTGKVGHATTTFSGENGRYEVELGYFKENDGGATIDLLVNGLKIGRSDVYDKTADKPPTAANFSTSTYEVTLAKGDTIEVVGIGNNWAFAVVDHINLKPLFDVEPMPKVLNLAELTPDQGFTIFGEPSVFVLTGETVSGAGDVNGDGFDDVLVGSLHANKGLGEFYLINGGTAPSDLEAKDLNGVNGTNLFSELPYVSTGSGLDGNGDFDGDGVPDILVSAPNEDRSEPGEEPFATLFISGAAISIGAPSLSVKTLSENNGFSIDHAGGIPFFVGDINNDGFDDAVINVSITACGVSPPDATTQVVFGGKDLSSMPENFDALDGSNGFRITGMDGNGCNETLADSAGDVNGDGIDDLIVTPQQRTITGVSASETTRSVVAYVIFGKTDTFSASFDVTSLNGNNGFTINGFAETTSSSRYDVSGVGDVNGDGTDDVAVKDGTGTHVIYGKAGGFDATFDVSTLNGANGSLILIGARSIAGAGDVNGDGLDDVIIGKSFADGSGTNSGSAFVVYGNEDGLPAVVDPTTLNSQQGFRINGKEAFDLLGNSVDAAGDVNGDGFDDVIIGAQTASGKNNENFSAGEAYVVYGGDFADKVTHQGSPEANHLKGGGAADIMVGGRGIGTIAGGGGADAIRGGQGDDVIGVADSAFRRVDGGTGYDTLRLDGSNQVLDLTKIADNRIRGIEKFDLNGDGNGLVMGVQDLANLQIAAGAIAVTGDASNKVSINLIGHGFVGTSADGVNTYSNGRLTFSVPEAIDQSGIVIEEPIWPPFGPVDDMAAITVGEADTVGGNVLSNDLAPEGSTLMVAAPGSLIGTFGTLDVAADGSFTYDLDETNDTVGELLTGKTLTDSFTYQAESDSGETADAILKVTINGSADPKVEPPTAMTLEAETMTLSGDYVVRDLDDASGGQAITLPMGKSTTGKTGQASTAFSGTSGWYEVELGYFKEQDGGAKIDLYVGGEKLGQSRVYEKGAGTTPSAANFDTDTYIAEIEQGDNVQIVGIGSNWAFAVVDYVAFTPLADTSDIWG